MAYSGLISGGYMNPAARILTIHDKLLRHR